MKLHKRLWCLKSKKVTELDFLEKISFLGKAQKFRQYTIFGVGKNFSPLMCAFFDLHDAQYLPLYI